MIASLTYYLLVVASLTSVLGVAPSRRDDDSKPIRNVAIIGAGAAGASAAYHLSQYARDENLPVNITIFEKTPRVGGRTLTVHAYDDPTSGEQPVELGASIFVTANRIMHDAALAFNLTLQDPMPSRKGDLTIIWDGASVVFESTEDGSSWWWEAARLWWRYGMSPYRAVNLIKTVVATFLKLYDPPYFPFRSLTQRAYELGLERVTGVTGAQFLADAGVNHDFCRHILQPATRVNYASNLAHIHGLETMVSFATDGAVAVRGGNWQIFDKMIEASGATIYRNATVRAINFKPEGPNSVARALKKYDISVAGDDAVRAAFDDIIIATPWQYSNISAGRGIITHKIDEIPYKELHVVLFTSPYQLRTDLFGLPRGGTPPSNVYTTLKDGVEADPDNVVGETGFLSLSTLRTLVNPVTGQTEYLYKLFSPEEVAPARLDGFFDSDWKDKQEVSDEHKSDGDSGPKEPAKVTWYRMQTFNPYPVELPRVTFQDPVVGNGVYYTSGIESFISTMETSALMGKNVARLLADDVAGNAGTGGAYVAPYRPSPNHPQREDFFQSMENDLDDMMMMDEL
ncbi:Prenylcysteine oxidase [Cordyceps fumosorosea ARSEF 2679]|uniref:Prenylcysteine oxidase n=1 Tax=Cordyceps fumosorosea (strain ARSEF 2679) TaxID=1081104 RepID=A0A168EAG9_CORFA|nr:Prenylcysteine oxidase [Cordyceps fumosorosea ARSEF 2679]OAA73577.1 Prenylcysteine oxidase [Cordyceps fumosorosea ARSEF 2679]